MTLIDSQTTELIGRNILVEQLLGAGIEVAFPIRDHGIDLLAYIDGGEAIRAFTACPIQLKVASTASFSFDQKYAKFPSLLHVFVWGVSSRANVSIFALTHPEVVEIGDKLGFSRSASWKTGKYSTSHPGKNLIAALEPYQMTPQRWHQMISHLQNASIKNC